MRAGPPFPYLRWTGSRNWPALPSPTSGGVGLRKRGGAALDGPPSLRSRPGGGSLQGRRQVLRERRLDVDAPAGHRMVEGQTGGVQELALQPVEAGGGRTRDRRPPGGRSPEGGRGSGAFAPSPGARAGASMRAARARRAKCVTAVRGHVACRPRSACARGGRAPGARRSCPSAPAVGPRRAPGTHARSGAPSSARAGAGAPPRSSPRPAAPRCRGRDGARSPRARARAPRPPVRPAPGRACPCGGRERGARRRPPACPRRAGRRPRSGPRRARRCGRPAAGARPPRRRRSRRRAGGGAWAADAPSTRTRPASISRCARAREPSGPARNASRRSPASAAVTFELTRHPRSS